MTGLERRIRSAAADEVARALTENGLELSSGRKAHGGGVTHEGCLVDGTRVEVFRDLGDAPRVNITLWNAEGICEASFLVRRDGLVVGNPMGLGYEVGDVVGPRMTDLARDIAALARSAAGSAFSVPPAPAPGLWVAYFESRSTSCRAFGATPEEAAAALDALWRGDYAGESGADPDYVAENRDALSVHPAEVGRAYILGAGDWLWHKGGFNGEDERFDAVFGTGAAPSPR